MSSSLCSEAFVTVTPPIFTGSRIANGLMLPVLPTFSPIEINFVLVCSAGNLYAMAHLGSRPTNPKVF